MKQFYALPALGPERCCVSVSTRFEKQAKSAVKRCFSAVEHALFFQQTSFFPQPTRMYFLLCKKATLLLNFHATMTVGMQDCRPYLKLQNRIKHHFPIQFALGLLSKNIFLFQGANPSPSLVFSPLLLIQPVKFISCKILPVQFAQHYDDSIFSSLFSLQLPLKLLSLKSPTLSTVAKRIRRQFEILYKMPLFLVLSSYSRLGFFIQIAVIFLRSPF